MFTPRSIIPILLIGGLVVIEVLSGKPAQSQHQLSQNETDLILSILHGDAKTEEQLPSSVFPFLELDLPGSPGGVAVDAQSSYSTVIGTPSYNSRPTSTTPSSGSVLDDVLPPFSSPLYYAYQDGGVAWYSQGTNVLVIMPDETIRSFNASTGEETDWQQDKLARLPVNDPGAYANYQTSYKARIVAETKTWVLMEFPSKGILKVSKPQYSTSPSGTIFGLPNVLPNSNP